MQRLLGNLAAPSLSVVGKCQQQQLRRLNIHGYQHPWWNPAVEEQAVMNIHPIRQTNSTKDGLL
ncbi:DNA/RNA helicase protein [Perilla frutescens var. frutescens]|nr:DNA/RNA helicase protein [Perilla frutescens var. frutescens]